MDAEQVAATIDRIYQAAERSELWKDVLDDICGELNAPAAVLHLQHTKQPQSAHVHCAVGVDVAMQELYETHYASTNIWTLTGRDLLVQGAVLTGEMICSDAVVERSEYYNDYLRKLGFFHSIATIPLMQGSDSLIVSSLRPRQSGPFGSDAVRWLRALSPHLLRAAALHEKWTELSGREQGLEDTLEQVSFGVALLDARGRVVHANAAAKAILSSNALTLHADGLRNGSSTATGALRASIRQAVSTDRRTGAMLLVPRPGKPPLQVSIMPLRLAAPDAKVRAAVFVVDPTCAELPSAESLERLYALSPTEAQVAVQLAQGASVREVAAQRSTKEENVRWTIKQILQKTDSRNQAQAVSKILRSLAALTRIYR